MIRPYFFECTVISEKYRDKLEEVVVELGHGPVFEGIRNKPISQQEGAPPHCGITVRDFLTTTLPSG